MRHGGEREREPASTNTEHGLARQTLNLIADDRREVEPIGDANGGVTAGKRFTHFGPVLAIAPAMSDSLNVLTTSEHVE